MHKHCKPLQSAIRAKYPFCYQQYFKDYWVQRLKPGMDSNILYPEHTFELYHSDALIFGIRLDYQVGMGLLPYALNFYLSETPDRIDELDHSFAVFELTDYLNLHQESLVNDGLYEPIKLAINNTILRLINAYHAVIEKEPYVKSVYTLGDWLQGLLATEAFKCLAEDTIKAMVESKETPLFSINLLMLLLDPLVDDLMVIRKEKNLIERHLKIVENSPLFAKEEDQILISYIKHQLVYKSIDSA